MFVLLRKKLVHNVRLVGDLTKTQLGSPQTRSLSSSTSFGKQSFTVSYLMNSCGLSLENAITVSKKVHFETPDKPDSVLRLLKNHGFTDAQITKIVRRRSRVIVANHEKTLLPKLEFFQSIGLSSTVLGKVVSAYPSVLAHSLDRHIVPCYEFIKSFVNDDEKVAIVLKKCPKILQHDFRKRLAPNIAVLKDHGVPTSSIASSLTHNASFLLEKCDKFKKCVVEVMEMGFSPSTLVFVVALQVTAVMTESTWNRKMEVYRRWGWSETEFRGAFRSNPLVMNFSETKITSVMEFLENKMGLKTEIVARNPSVLGLCLEKRIIPRCSVMKALLLKGLIKRDLGLGSYLFPTEKIFLDKFVTKYEEDAPQLWSVYEGNLRIF